MANDRVRQSGKGGRGADSEISDIGRERHLALDLTDSGLTAERAAALLMGVRLRGWRMDSYRTTQKDEQKTTLTTVTVVGAPDGTDAAWADAAAVAAGVEFTRELVTEPANVIYPDSFVERCQERLDGLGVEFTVLDEEEMDELGMGALLGVGQGSRTAIRAFWPCAGRAATMRDQADVPLSARA